MEGILFFYLTVSFSFGLLQLKLRSDFLSQTTHRSWLSASVSVSLLLYCVVCCCHAGAMLFRRRSLVVFAALAAGLYIFYSRTSALVPIVGNQPSSLRSHHKKHTTEHNINISTLMCSQFYGFFVYINLQYKTDYKNMKYKLHYL